MAVSRRYSQSIAPAPRSWARASSTSAASRAATRSGSSAIAAVRRDGRAVAGLEEVPEGLGRGEALHPQRPALGPHAVHPVAEQVAHVLLVAPQRRRLGPGRRRGDVRLHGREHPADEPLGRPAEQPDGAAAAADPHELVGAGRWCGANITPTQDITTSKAPSSNGSASASACRHSTRCPLLREPAAESSSSGVRSLATTCAPVAARRERRVAGARGHVEHPLAGPDAAGRHQHGAEVGMTSLRDRRVVPAAPTSARCFAFSARSACSAVLVPVVRAHLVLLVVVPVVAREHQRAAPRRAAASVLRTDPGTGRVGP